MAKKSQLDKAIESLRAEVEAMDRDEDARRVAHQAAVDAKCGAIDTLKAMQKPRVRKPRAVPASEAKAAS